MTRVEEGQARKRFSELLSLAEQGEEVLICRDTHPVVRLVPVRSSSTSRRPGTARGKIWISPDFDEPLEEFEQYS